MLEEFIEYVDEDIDILQILSKLEVKARILNALQQDCFENFNITLGLGAELEFYLSEDIGINELTSIFEYSLRDYQVVFEKEKGHRQYELKLPIINNACILANNLTNIKRIILNELKVYNINITFLAKPHVDQPGSSLHIHLSLWNGIENLFKKYSDRESEIMLNVIGGICDTLSEAMILFAPSENCYKRLVKDSDAPTTISWGGNNRTVALRIPDSASGDRRVELRIPSSASDPYVVLISILMAAYYGIKNKLMAPKRIYGNAAHEQYNLEKLPTTLQDALKQFKKSQIIKPWLKELIY